MSEQPKKSDRTLSEISHLFLSSVRARQTHGAARPQRTPPAPEPAGDPLAHVLTDATSVRAAPVAAVLASHLGSRQANRAREYAAHLCQSGEAHRVGLIEVDAGALCISCFDRVSRADDGSAPDVDHAATHECLDARRISDSLQELSWDVDRWIVLLAAPRAAEARSLLRAIDQWVLLTTCDHDGVVASYRTLKGLADVNHADGANARFRPKLSLALLDAHDDAEADHVFRKLASACGQFLDWHLETEAPVRRAVGVASCDVLVCRGTRDKAHSAAAPQWQAVADFVMKMKAPNAKPPEKPMPAPAAAAAPQATDAPAPLQFAANRASEAPVQQPADDVIEIPQNDRAPASIVSAVLRARNDLVECPVRPPMCDDARLAVGRDRRIVLLAVARQGLTDLRSISQAYRWLNENRPLIAMALPQFAIDAHAMPRLQLLVDHADVSAELLQPILQSSNVTVHAYRTLRWAGRTGLLLEAA